MCIRDRAYNLEGTITAGRNDRYTMEIYNLIGIDPTALEPMGFALQSGSWLTNTPASEKAAKLQILVGGSTGYCLLYTSHTARRLHAAAAFSSVGAALGHRAVRQLPCLGRAAAGLGTPGGV